MVENASQLPESQHGPAEKLLDVVLGSSAHLWHNRPGLNVGGRWIPATARRTRSFQPGEATPVRPGLFVPAAVDLYRRLLEIYQLNPLLMAHFAGYALLETEWRDLKVACAALMLVQPTAGLPIKDDDGSLAFYDDDYRTIGEAMILHYEKGSKHMLPPKGVLRVAQLLEVPDIADLNRAAGFASPASRKAPLGRWKSAAKQWLSFRERNLPMLKGLVKTGYKETIKKIARKAGYKPQSQAFFELLGWRQKQSDQGHRKVGMSGLNLVKSERFDGLSEEAVCEAIVKGKLSYKEVVGRLPAELGLTPAIMVTLLPSLSDRDLRQLTPTLEGLGLLEDEGVRTRWERAVQTATDQRALNIAKNVKSAVVREKLEEAADAAARNAVAAATKEVDLHVFFLIDKSGSMQGAIEQSKEAISRMLAGFAPDRLHVAAFDSMGLVLKPKAPSRTAVQHMLKNLRASGGTMHASAIRALHRDGVRVPSNSKLIVIVVGDEAGEQGELFASCFSENGYDVDGFAFIDCSGASGWSRGHTVRGAAASLRVPFSEITVEQFEDPYQVPRVLKAILEAPRAAGFGQSAWVDKVMGTPLLEKSVLV
jgi:hypothetical protein